MSVAACKLERVLIVEDNAALRGAIAKLARSWGAVALEASTADQAIRALRRPVDLVICDVRLPDGSAVSVLEKARSLSPEPAKIAISGVATAEEAFRLGQLGVREFLAKPFTLDALEASVERVGREAPDLDPMVRASVGHVPMRELQRRVRNLMVEEALARSGGSRRSAARLLEVSRQAVQQIVRAGRPEAVEGVDSVCESDRESELSAD